jgi:glycosyltransferase involved in cell wall biosynthesis
LNKQINETSILENEETLPYISIVIPASNEEITISTFLDWCIEGLAKSKVSGEIIIVSSSSDRTTEIATNKGAIVIETPKKGLGRAYLDAIPFIRGELVIMGDADCTYDFRDIEDFILKYESGCDFIMGSRFLGTIEKGSMPLLHRYFGTPITTWILNKIYSSNFSDIHCGMRAISLKALKEIKLDSESWEYASEMLIKVIKSGYKFDEVPVKFYRDFEGRKSHHIRDGFLSPFKAGLLNIKSMLIYGIDLLLLKPAKFIFLTTFGPLLYLTFTNINFSDRSLSLGTQVLLSQISLISSQFYFTALIAGQNNLNNNTSKFFKIERINFLSVTSLVLFTLGSFMMYPSVLKILLISETPESQIATIKIVVLGFYFILLSLIVFFNSIILIFKNRQNKI